MLPSLPILRFGREYASLDLANVADPRTGEAIATVSIANAGIIRRDLKKLPKAAAVLRAMSCAELIAICRKAGELFMTADLPLGEGMTQSPDGYIHTLSITSGLPHNLCRANMAKINTVFTGMDTILRGLTRGLDLAVLDRAIGEADGLTVNYHAMTDALGVVLPSNSPGVNSIWLPAIALKTPVILKPGRDEPWTPWRIAQAFIAAGCPGEAIGFYPTDHDGANTIMTGCDRAIIFGDDSTLSRYAGNPAVQCHGTGRSKILIGEDVVDRWQEYLDILVRSILDNGGRSCINASCIMTPRHGDAIANALAEQLAEVAPEAADDPQAKLSAFANPKFADYIDQAIEQGLAAPGARDVTFEKRQSPRRTERDGYVYLRPTIIRCDRLDHPLANTEYLFPFASVVEVPQRQMLSSIGPSLVVTAITEDKSFIQNLLACRQIDRLNIGPLPTSRVEWDQPHEGNLFEFLYRRRAIAKAVT